MLPKKDMHAMNNLGIPQTDTTRIILLESKRERANGRMLGIYPSSSPQVSMSDLANVKQRTVSMNSNASYEVQSLRFRLG